MATRARHEHNTTRHDNADRCCYLSAFRRFGLSWTIREVRAWRILSITPSDWLIHSAPSSLKQMAAHLLPSSIASCNIIWTGHEMIFWLWQAHSTTSRNVDLSPFCRFKHVDTAAILTPSYAFKYVRTLSCPLKHISI